MLRQNATTWTWRAAATVALLAALTAAGLLTLRPAASAAPGDDVALPDLVADRPEDPAIYIDDSAGGDPLLLLRFDGYIHNAGDGELMVIGHRDSTAQEVLGVRQVFSPQGESSMNRDDEDWLRHVALPRAQIKYDRGDGHEHFHLDRISRYSLWNADRTALSAPSMKVGFCLTDSRRVETRGPAQRHWDADRIAPCGHRDFDDLFVQEGISSGWRDWYRAGIAYQWVDISGVLPGSYWLRADIDPDEYVIESNETNPPAYATAATIVPGYNAIAASKQTDEDTPLDIALTAQRWSGATADSQPGSSRPAFAIVDGPDHGTLGAIASDGTVRYTPHNGYHGPDSFSFSARDPTSGFPTSPAVATVSLQVDEVPRPSVTIDNAPDRMVAGESVQLGATVVDEADPAVTWSAGGGTIDASGRFTAPGERPVGGTVTVTARTANATDSAVIEIEARPVVPRPSVTIDGAPDRMVAGTSVDLDATVLDEANPTVTWSATDGTIDASGRFTAPGEPPVGGTVTVTARTANATDSAVIEIEARPVVPRPSVTIDGAPGSMQAGTSAQLSATVQDEDDPTVTWSTTAGAIDASGRLTAPATPPAGGTLQVTARTANATATVTIGVTPRDAPPQPKVTIGETPGSLLAGETLPLSASVSNDAPGVTWSATGGTITAGGLFTAPDAPPAGGTVTVTATSASGASDARTIEIRAKPEPPKPIVAISGAPEKLVAGTTVQLSATVTDDLPSVAWSASAGTITPAGAFTAPENAPDGGSVQVTAKSSRASDTRTIAIEAKPVVIPRPIPIPEEHHEHHEHHEPGTRPQTTRPLSAIATQRIGRQIAMSVTPSKAGRLRLTAYAGRRRLGSCVARVRSRRLFTCRVRLPRGVSTSARIRVVAGLRVGRKVSRVERRAAPIGKAAHGH